MKKRLERPSSEPPCFEEEPRSPQKTGTTASLDRDNEGLRKKSGMWTVCSGWEGKEEGTKSDIILNVDSLLSIQYKQDSFPWHLPLMTGARY